MRKRSFTSRPWIWLIAALLLLVGPTPTQAQDDPRGRLFALINQVRLREGLAPLGNSTLLNQAAQRHAEDLVGIGRVTHDGSDGSSYQQRIHEARYNAWNDGLMVNEAVWTGLGTAEDALTWFRSNPEWAILTDSRYREAGIGYADDNGVRYFVVALGARPGVLPVFVNDGTETTDSPQVALRLTNEESVPLGDGSWIGKAIEVRLSNSPDFDGVPWQPWEPLLPWLLASDVPGEYAVYVEFRDGANRTTIAEDIVRLVAPGESPPTPTPFLDLLEITPEPEMGTPLPVTPSAESPEVPPSPPAPTTAAESPPTPVTSESTGDTLAPFPTWTPLPTDVPGPTESKATDWSLLAVFVLQGAAVLLGIAAFLRRR